MASRIVPERTWVSVHIPHIHLGGESGPSFRSHFSFNSNPVQIASEDFKALLVFSGYAIVHHVASGQLKNPL